MSERIPRHTLNDLDNYVHHHHPVSAFLYAVLSNNLYVACMKADEYNRPVLVDIALYVEAELPIACRGSVEAVETWLEIRMG